MEVLAAQEMKVLWPFGVVLSGDGVKPPRAALAEDRRGERPGKRRRESRQVGIGKTNVSEPLLKRRD